MNPLLKKLETISKKKERRIIGLMSGTSMDGLDIALCRFRGSGPDTRFELDEFTSVTYPEEVNRQLISFATADCLDPQLLCVWHTWLAHLHAAYVRQALKTWGVPADEVDLLASHGQTIFHAPKHKHKMEGMPNATLQIGDGDHLAQQTGIITISDFRQRDTARGNEGAPLAAYGDYLLFSDAGTHRILLNIGGISNFTWLPAGSGEFPPLSFDTGPGNTLIDAATRKHFTGMQFDKDGALAASGTVHNELLALLMQHPYFQKSAPKTTGFEVFHMSWVESCMVQAGVVMEDDLPDAGRDDRPDALKEEHRRESQAEPGEDDGRENDGREEDGRENDGREEGGEKAEKKEALKKKKLEPDTVSAVDLLATLTRLTVETVADQIKKAIPEGGQAQVCVSGGGAYNDTLMAGLKEALDPVPVSRIDDLGVSADAKEALFFAALANELVCGEDTRLHLGKISLPDR
ncbi:MAG: anhydro-N-acetylmuramic acid kinase [Balneolaceae bacterium]|nr:MAG: anhydro-N-acetylmuramic acid kinase [Balneolaceae bacterium]